VIHTVPKPGQPIAVADPHHGEPTLSGLLEQLVQTGPSLPQPAHAVCEHTADRRGAGAPQFVFPPGQRRLLPTGTRHPNAEGPDAIPRDRPSPGQGVQIGFVEPPSRPYLPDPAQRHLTLIGPTAQRHRVNPQPFGSSSQTQDSHNAMLERGSRV
jgi:hypothetical protein